MKSELKKALISVLRIICIPFMLIGIALWGVLTFARIGIEALGKRKGELAE